MEPFRDGQHPIVVFTDGACSGNPGPGGWGAIVATPDGHVYEMGDGDPETTNNRMELVATIRPLATLRDTSGPVHIYTDSVYVIRGITQWIFGWRNRGWKTAEGNDVANRELFEELLRLVTARSKTGPVSWKWVKGHSGIAGNERVDEIAVAFTKRQRIKLYKGPLLEYGVAVMDLPVDRPLPEIKDKEPKAKAFSYLSVVDGVVERHATWPECERRVKGRSGARFKKAMSSADEQTILSSWGVKLR